MLVHPKKKTIKICHHLLVTSFQTHMTVTYLKLKRKRFSRIFTALLTNMKRYSEEQATEKKCDKTTIKVPWKQKYSIWFVHHISSLLKLYNSFLWGTDPNASQRKPLRLDQQEYLQFSVNYSLKLLDVYIVFFLSQFPYTVILCCYWSAACCNVEELTEADCSCKTRANEM